MEVGRGTTFTAPHLDDEAAAITTRLATITDEGVTERRRRVDLDLMSQCVGTIVGDDDFYAHARPPLAGGRSATASRPGSCSRCATAATSATSCSSARTSGRTRGPPPRSRCGPISGAPAGRLALARRVVDLDLAGTIKVHGVGESDPLLSWVQGPRGLGDVRPFDSLWVRLVDLPEALARAGYEADCDVVVEVADEPAPWNAGRWRIRVKDGTADVTRTDDDAEVSLPVTALGAAYLGGTNLAALHRAGVIAEHRPGAARELWRAFRTDVGPYAARGF